ncbi:glutathione S-transferase C-terminal-like protein [Cristinia sonorae]|uniref:glutathione transferase n=1 Tax=Cristinia sonorae TaxID=1940300 RepID=A0A8K0UJ12_9AGAR|nr:glutathione S-transferase C-terminal-like protein [Cristinia sonorae]
MSHGKHFTLYSHTGGPNPWKVVFLLKELGLDYEPVYLDFQKGEHKAPGYLKVNPNGRVPALIDHKNNDFTIWESGAILLYLVDKYDTEKKYTSTNETEKYQVIQWLFFQVSGQGPYFGQAAWFQVFHPEKIPSAIERYQNEVKRVLGVLESVLSKQEWLAAGKFTIADLAFVPWNNGISFLLGPDFNFEKEFPFTYKWHQKVLEVPGVKAGLAEKDRLAAAK